MAAFEIIVLARVNDDGIATEHFDQFIRFNHETA
jgi:hypothetical protein